LKRNQFNIIVISLISGIIGSTITFYFITKKKDEENKLLKRKEDKFRKYYQLTNEWLLLKGQKKSIIDYMLYMNYKKIAIYGMGELGNRLYEELENSSIQVLYAIDKYPENNHSNLEFCELSTNIKKVDAIIVTPIFDYEVISSEISDVVDYPVISLEDIIFQR
jgi:hypothetical protein